MDKREGIWEMKRELLGKIALIFSFSLLLALFSQIRIPLSFTPVPLTLQTLGVLFIGYYLGAFAGVASVILYLTLGAIGFPFFAGLKGGLLSLSGPTGGYLVGFIAGVYIVGKAKEMGLLKNPFIAFLTALFMHLIIYFFGTLWFLGGFYFLGWSKTLKDLLTLTVFPFIPTDIIKSLLFAGFVLAENKVYKVVRK
ncbi:MAG: biotin transporter BioY [Caldimicrobium sp.]